MGEGLAVLYTTHYMEEAERLCDRVGIIDEGRLIAEGTRDELVADIGSHGSITVTVVGDASPLVQRCRGLPGVLTAELVDTTTVVVVARDTALVLSEVVSAINDSGTPLTGVEVSEPDLEDVFLHVTGKALRDHS